MSFIIILAIFSYLIGSLNTSIFLCKLFHLPDPRTQGSKNPGATNMLRIAGKSIGLLTLILDILKGVLPILVAKWCGFSETCQAWIALAVTLGHLYPVFFHFQGGKGVATAIGAIFALAWPIGSCLTLIWLVVMAMTRYVSLSSIMSSACLPFVTYFLGHAALLVPLSLISLNVIFKHKSNLKRLIAGQETKIGKNN